MNRCFLSILFSISFTTAFSQTNKFPETGNVGIGTTTPQADLDIFRIYVPGKPTALRMLYNGSWNDANYATGFRFLDLASTEGGKILQVNGYGMGLGFDPPAYASASKLLVNGNVGIGTDQPGAKLEIKGAPYWTSHHWGKAIKLNTGSAIQFTSDGGNFGMGATNPGGLYFFTTTADDTSQPANHIMAMTANGNVGIGTITPNSKLAVNGNIRAREIKVENGNWPDYVFLPSYQLPSLQEMEKHIKEKGHLSGIPSALEVKTNGINLGEMNALLLKKIEELTLIMIEMQKSNELRNTKNEKEIEYLKSKIK